MKILIIQENGHHFPNRIYRECFALQRAFTEYEDITAVVWGNKHANFNDPINFNDFDVIICAEQYDTGWVPHTEIAKSRALKLLWAIDSHSRGIEFFRNLRNVGKYQTILCSIKHHVNKHSVWFPNAFDDMMIKPLKVQQRAQIGFCGSAGSKERIDIMQQIKSVYPNFIFDDFVIGDKMVESICSFNMHFNMNILDDINYRSFETIGCGVPLFTSYNYQYNELGFIDGVNCIMYNKDKLGDAVEKFNYYSQSLALPEIGSEGYKLSKKHSYRARVAKLLKYIKHG